MCDFWPRLETRHPSWDRALNQYGTCFVYPDKIILVTSSRTRSDSGSMKLCHDHTRMSLEV